MDFFGPCLKSGKKKEAFETIAATLIRHNGKAMKFPEEAKALIANQAVNRFFDSYKIKAKESIAIAQQNFLDERRQITAGKKS